MDRRVISEILDDCGTLLELKGENPFRCNAYHVAARAVLQLEGDLLGLVEDGSLTKVKGIGETMAEKIAELVRTGALEFHDKLRAEVPPGFFDMMRIAGFGPKRIRIVHDQLGIDSIDALRAACLDGRVAALKGFGKKSAEKILTGIEFRDKTGQRVLYPIALELAERLRDALAGHPAVRKIEICGSLRRCRETIKDIDLLVASDDPAPIMKRFVEHPEVVQVVGHGETKSSILLSIGTAADLRIVSPSQFPFALHYFTGSKDHNVAMRARAQSRGLKLNEYELAGPDRKVDCPDEVALFEALGLEFIPPELREDTGEIDAAAARSLPKLVEPGDITGVFHCHTNASDGKATLEEMVEGARQAGYHYLGIADHSRTAAYAGGLSVERVRDQQKKIDALNQKLKGFHVFKGIESDILPDGSLDYDDDTLASFDYVVASVHSSLTMDEAAMTERVLRAIRHPRCTMLGHPTGRLLLRRESFAIDVEKILVEAARRQVMIEINANPHRLDLDWVFCKRAKALGVTLVINPDAHSVEGFDHVRFGVATARRGWLAAENVFNTRGPKAIAKELKERRERT